MQISAILIVEGDPMELGDILREMADVVDSHAFEWDDEWWNKKRAEAFVARVKPSALGAVDYILRNGPEVPFEDVQQVLGVDGRTIGGMMSSVGFTERDLGVPQPLIGRDYNRRVYVVDEKSAAYVRDALDRERGVES